MGVSREWRFGMKAHVGTDPNGLVHTLVSKNQVAYEFVYFLGISGGAQVLITPALGRFGYSD